MSLDSTFLLTVKEHVTAKLKSLGAFIDEELPDYIMVMVANKKSEHSMAKDLQLFLGEHTLEFTKWLHQKLVDLQHGDTPKLRSKEKDCTHIWGRNKSEKRKINKNQVVDSSQSPNAQRSRSRSPVCSRSSEHSVTHSREPHGNIEQFTLHPDENEFISESASSVTSVRETRKVISTSSLFPKSEGDHEENSIDSTQKSAGIRSVVKVKKAQARERPRVDRTSGKSIEPVGRLLQQAVKEARESIQPPDSTHSSTNSNKPIACSDVSSTANVGGRTKFFVTLSGMAKNKLNNSSLADSSADFCCRADGRHVTELGKRTDVKSRLGDRRMLPYSRSTKLSARERLGPINQLDVFEHTVSNASDDDLRYELMDTPEDVELIEGNVDEDDFTQLDGDDGFPPEESTRSVVAVRDGPVSLIDRLNKRHLVVSLNEAEEDDDVLPMASEKLARLTKSTHVSSPSKVTGKQGNIPSNLERCRYWPNCKNGDNCPYIHPSEPCPTFPRCRLGSTCTYIHPPCRFGAFCARDDCAFAHTTKRIVPQIPSVPSVNVSQVVCRFQHRCINPICPYYHPPPIPRLPLSRPVIAPIHPLTISPVPCRYGSACTNRPNCPFTHPDTPRPEQLKWVAASKQSSVTDSSSATTSTANISRQTVAKTTAPNTIGISVSSR